MFRRPISGRAVFFAWATIIAVLFAAGCGDEASQVPERSAEQVDSPVAKVDEAAPPEDLSSSAWEQITAQIAADRRQIEWDDEAPAWLGGGHGEGAYRAAMPDHALTAWMGSQGVVVRPSARQKADDAQGEQKAAGWQLELAFEGVGRAGDLRRMASKGVRAEANRLEIERGSVTEWYISDERGLEQGFDIHQRPEGTGNLVVEVGVSGDLIPQLVDKTSVQFEAPSGELVLGYSGLIAWDATGNRLAAHMEVGDDSVSLVVDDTDAVYPVTVDPWLESKKIVPSDGAGGDEFGRAVAIGGDVVVVGAWGDDDNGSESGSAYVFTQNQGGTNNFGLVKKLVPSDGAAGDEFGRSVATSGDVVVVGAWSDTDNGPDSGSAYVFGRHQGGADNFGLVKKLLAPDGAEWDEFGHSVAVSGDLVVVGAYGDADKGPGAGSAYVFGRNQGGADNYGEVKKLLAFDGAGFHHFGDSVAVSGDVVVVGASHDYENGSESGSAYVFTQNQGGADNFGLVKKLVPSDGATDHRFGQAVAISGYTVVVGAWGDDDNGSESGSAYVFTQNHGGTNNFGEVKKLVPSDGAGGDEFGRSVAISGDVVVVGAWGDDDNGPESGSAYLFDRHQGGADNFGEVKKLLASDGAADKRFGGSVSVSEDLMVVGAYGDDINGRTSGSAYILGVNAPPVGNDDAASVDEDGAVTVDVLGNDTDPEGDALTIDSASQPINGAVANQGSDLTYTPNPNYSGRDSFTYTVSDGKGNVATATVSVTVHPVNDAPVLTSTAVTSATEDQSYHYWVTSDDIDGDSLTIGASTLPGWLTLTDHGGGTASLTGTPTNDEVGMHTVVLEVTDGTASDTQSFDVTVSNVNDAPVAQPDTASTDEDTPVTVDVLANDEDPDGDVLSVTLTVPASNGTASVNTDGTMTYSPRADYTGSDSFTYETDDANGGMDTATVAITIANTNDAPSFVAPTPADQEVLRVNDTETLQLRLAADDIDGDTLTYEVAPLPAEASLDAATGAVSWTPGWQDAGTYQWELSASDGSLSDTRQITVEVSFVDVDGDGLPDNWETQNGLDPLAADSDGDGIADGEEVGDDLEEPLDSDGDDTIDALDDDSDNDGVLDAEEAGDDDLATAAPDTDQDGTPDYLDSDSDEDGVDDTNDACSLESGQTDDGCPQNTQSSGPQEQGCGCSSTSAPSSALSVVFVLIGLVGLRLRRRTP